jgi:hypothetical protein
MMDKGDIDYALHGIRMMMQVAVDAVITIEKSNTEPGFFRLTEPDYNALHFSLFDIEKRVGELKDELKAEQPSTAAPNPSSDGQRSGATGKPEVDWCDLYRGIEGPLCEALHMSQIADGLVDHVDYNDSDSREQVAFAVNHGRQMLEDLRRRYYEHERTED